MWMCVCVSVINTSFALNRTLACVRLAREWLNKAQIINFYIFFNEIAIIYWRAFNEKCCICYSLPWHCLKHDSINFQTVFVVVVWVLLIPGCCGLCVCIRMTWFCHPFRYIVFFHHQSNWLADVFCPCHFRPAGNFVKPKLHYDAEKNSHRSKSSKSNFRKTFSYFSSNMLLRFTCPSIKIHPENESQVHPNHTQAHFSVLFHWEKVGNWRNFFHVSFAICNNKINIWNLSRHNKYAKHQFESIDDDGSQAENLKFDKWKTLKESLWVCEVFTVNPSQCDGSFGSVIFRRRFPVGFQCLLTELTSCVSHNTHTHTGDTNDLFTARLEKKVKSTSWSQSAQVRP